MKSTIRPFIFALLALGASVPNQSFGQSAGQPTILNSCEHVKEIQRLKNLDQEYRKLIEDERVLTRQATEKADYCKLYQQARGGGKPICRRDFSALRQDQGRIIERRKALQSRANELAQPLEQLKYSSCAASLRRDAASENDGVDLQVAIQRTRAECRCQ